MKNNRCCNIFIKGLICLMLFASPVFAENGEAMFEDAVEGAAAELQEFNEDPGAAVPEESVIEQVMEGPDEMVQPTLAPQTVEVQSSGVVQHAVPQVTEPWNVGVPQHAVPQVPEPQPVIVQEPVIPQVPEVQPGDVPEPAMTQIPEIQPEAVQKLSVPQVPEVPVATVPELGVPPIQETQPPVALQHSVQDTTQAETVPAVSEEILTPTPNPSGVIQVSDYKYPVFLYAPRDYKTDRLYSLILIAPAESIKTQEQIDYLTGLAQRKSIFILAPNVLWPKPGDTPYELDRWLIEVKKDIVDRFPINKKRIYIMGRNSGAHYAAYLATKYPQEFTGVALFGEAWDGPFSQLITLSSDAVMQVPFFIALKAGSDTRARNQAWFDKLQKKGYWLYLTEYPTEQTLDDLEFKKTAYDWLEEASQSWIAEVAKRHQGWKGRFKKGLREFFTV
ncbi:MAG: hypothetical protein KTQ49_06030 [Candidatus Omnitrophica bacterium]|nr:hypothetical protein [Candidatus Omnitrophota bacterium]